MEEKTVVWVAFLLPLPLFIFIIRTMIVYSFILVPFWIVMPTVLQLYLQARELTVYKKAQILCWVKLAGEHNFTPEEREIITKALGETRRIPVRETKGWIKKYWKKMFTLLVIITSILVALIPV